MARLPRLTLAGYPHHIILRGNNRQAIFMDNADFQRMLALLQELKQDHAILLVEHDMDAVFRIADCITVMVNGNVIASGTPDEVRNNPDVRSAYLGDH